MMRIQSNRPILMRTYIGDLILIISLKIQFNNLFVSMILFSFAIYLRLIIVMGLNWIVEGVIVVIPKQMGREFEIISQVLDMCNALMGVIIFGLFVLKPSVLRLIKKRFLLFILHQNDNHFRNLIFFFLIACFIQVEFLVWKF